MKHDIMFRCRIKYDIEKSSSAECFTGLETSDWVAYVRKTERTKDKQKGSSPKWLLPSCDGQSQHTFHLIPIWNIFAKSITTQCLGRRIPDMQQLQMELSAWECARNTSSKSV